MEAIPYCLMGLIIAVVAYGLIFLILESKDKISDEARFFRLIITSILLSITNNLRNQLNTTEFPAVS